MIRHTALAAIGSLPAFAARAQEIQVEPAPEAGVAIPMTIVIVLCIGLLVASFTSSRRGHQD